MLSSEVAQTVVVVVVLRRWPPGPEEEPLMIIIPTALYRKPARVTRSYECDTLYKRTRVWLQLDARNIRSLLYHGKVLRRDT